MPRILILTILLFCSLKMNSCINEVTHYLKDNTLLFQDGEDRVPYGHNFNQVAVLEKALKNLDSLFLATKDNAYLSDKGIVLMVLKKYEEAEKIYLKIEKDSPNRYSTASNLGTLYELMGENSKALFWIEKSYKIEPNSHNNSEWIHINILKAKIKGENYFTSKFILGLEFGDSIEPRTLLQKDSLSKLLDALFYQLNERISFIKGKDKIVASLLFELGNIEYLLGNMFGAKENYKLAIRYGFTEKNIEKRLGNAYDTFYKEMIKNRSGGQIPKVDNSIMYSLQIITILLVLIVFIVLILAKKSK